MIFYRCWSYVGRLGGSYAVQDISIAGGCTSLIPAHEIFHALGRWHEQSRPDRDNFVTVQLDNVRNSEFLLTKLIHNNIIYCKHCMIYAKPYTIIIHDPTAYRHNFRKYRRSQVDPQEIPYDFDSIMHYGAYDFARNRRIPVIRPYTSSISISRLGQRHMLSHYDIMQVNIRYCPGMNVTVQLHTCI